MPTTATQLNELARLVRWAKGAGLIREPAPVKMGRPPGSGKRGPVKMPEEVRKMRMRIRNRLHMRQKRAAAKVGRVTPCAPN